MIDQLPLAATVVPITTDPSINRIVAPISAVPLKVSVVSLVILSVVDRPESLAEAKSGTVTVGGAESMVTATNHESV